MVKEANFSFYHELPTFSETRHFCGLIKNSNLYILLTISTVIQLIAVIFIGLLPEKFGFLPGDPKNPIYLGSVGISAFWILTLAISFYGFSKNSWISQIPLLCVEFSFCVFCSVGISFFAFELSTNPNLTTENSKNLWVSSIDVSIPLVFHLFYLFVVFCLTRDIRRKIANSEFIKRQNMLDDVCEEMLFEEEIANLRMTDLDRHHEHYAPGCSASCSSECSISMCSAEITINEMYNEYQQNRRILTFYDDLPRF